MKQRIKGLIVTENSDGKRIVCDWRMEKYAALVVCISVFLIACWFAYLSQNYKPLPFLAVPLAIVLVFRLIHKVEIVKKSDGSIVVTRRNDFYVKQQLLIKGDQNPKILHKIHGYRFTESLICYKNNLTEDTCFVLDGMRVSRVMNRYNLTLSREQAEEISKQLDLPLEIRN